jgi:hypothetical protein
MIFDKFINYKVFLLSFIIGIAFVYCIGYDIKHVVVYPNPINYNNLQYKDHLDNCFEFTPVDVKCPDDTTKIKTPPLQ